MSWRTTPRLQKILTFSRKYVKQGMVFMIKFMTLLYIQNIIHKTSHKNEKEIFDIIFKSLKNITQLARCKLDNRTSVRYNRQVAILERVRLEGYGNG